MATTEEKTTEEKPVYEAKVNTEEATDDATNEKNKATVEKKDDGSDESSDDEELMGIYDKPVLVEGKRERKKTEFLVKDQKEIKKEPAPMVFKGNGERLGTMDVVNHELSKCTALELKPLHKLLFGRDGKQTEIKKNIRNFNGFDFEKDSKEYENKKWGVERFTNDGLKRLLEILDLEKKGKRDEMKERVLEYLMNPKGSGRKVPDPKKKPAKKSKSGTKRKRTPAKKKASKDKVDDEEEEGDDEESDDDEGDNEGDDVEDEPPKKKKAVVKPKAKPKAPEKGKSPAKSKTPEKGKKEGKKDTKKSPKKSKPVTVKITIGKKPPPKKSQKKAKPVEDSSSDEEPLAKKLKKQPPTNDELVTLIKELLKDADLKVVTVKSICKEVYAKYPDFDLSDKKSFIKETVYSVISSDSDQ